jgi:hypothetical protein
MSSSDGSEEEVDLLEHLAALDLVGDQDGGVGCDTWTRVPVNSYPTRIGIDNVDEYLLTTARAEAEIVVKRLMTRAFGRRNRLHSSVTAADMMKVFLTPAILGHVKSFVNRHIRDKISSAELATFIQVELKLSFYTCTPGRFFDPQNVELYPSRSAGMTHARYAEVLKSLGSNTSADDNNSSEGWTAPLKHDRDIAGVFQLARTVCSAISYVEKVSILSMDDDLLRLRSVLVESFGLAHINNPKKGLGTVHHGIVSLCTGLFCCGHVGARGESVVEVVQILLLALTGCSVLSQATINNLLAFDRGYGGTEGEVMHLAMNLGCDLNGTAKKIASFPFTFGKAPGRNQVEVSEDGAQSVYWMSKVTPELASQGKTHYALAYKSGLGRVVLAQTTVPECGPGHWSFVSRNRGRDVPPPPTTNAALLAFEQNNVLQVTATQRTPEWFKARFGRFTGTAAWAVLNHRAKQMRLASHVASAEDGSFIDVFQCLSIKYDHDIPVVDDAEQMYSEEELRCMTNVALKDICRAKSLRLGGNKNDLVRRILDDGEGADDDVERPMEEVLMKCFFMAPAKSISMKLGSLNEINVQKWFPSFVDKHCSSGLHIEEMKEYGLLHLRGQPEAAFSPDAVASVLCPIRGRFIAICEWKTMTKTSTTETAERLLLARFGAFQTVDVVADADTFKLSIPKGSYRGQVLHDMCCAGLDDCFYTSASLTSIIRVVHLRMSGSTRANYIANLALLRARHLEWVYDISMPLYPFQEHQLGHCTDIDTLATTRALWTAINTLVAERGRPLPPGKHILPFSIALWNRTKGGIDVFSRMLKNCKSVHTSLNPGAAIWLRIVMTMVYNAHQALSLIKVRRIC